MGVAIRRGIVAMKITAWKDLIGDHTAVCTKQMQTAMLVNPDLREYIIKGLKFDLYEAIERIHKEAIKNEDVIILGPIEMKETDIADGVTIFRGIARVYVIRVSYRRVIDILEKVLDNGRSVAIVGEIDWPYVSELLEEIYSLRKYVSELEENQK